MNPKKFSKGELKEMKDSLKNSVYGEYMTPEEIEDLRKRQRQYYQEAREADKRLKERMQKEALQEKPTPKS